MAAPVLQFKRGAFSNLPALKAGEPGFTTDKYDLYVGLDNNSANNKFFGSHRYWERETTTVGSSVKVVEGSTNGSNFIALKSPDSLSGDLTYTLPGIQGSANSVLTNDGSGVLTWGSGSANPVFTGIATFNTDQVDINSTVDISGITTISSTAQSTSKDTGALIVEGGVGIEKNAYVGGLLAVTGVATVTSDLTVGGATTITGNLFVGGQSEFVGVVTFRGGTISIGDANTDDVVIGGEFASDLIPTTDDTFSLGSSSKQWKDLYVNGTADIDALTVSGVSTFTGAAVFLGSITGTASTATRAVTVDTVTASDANAIHHLTFVNSHNLSASPETVFTDDGIFYNPGTNTFTTQHANFTGNVIAQGTITGTASTATRATTVDTTSTSTNADFFVPFVDTLAGENGETVRVGAGLSLNPSTGDVKVTGDLQIFGNDIKASDGNTNITLSSNTLTTFAGDIKVTGNDIQASDGNTNITLTSNTLTTFAGDIKVGGNDIQSSGGTTALTFSGADVTVAGDVTVGGNDIKASDGVTAITLTPTTGAVGVSSDLTVSGKLFVLGTTTEINTETLKVEDSLIEVGLVNSGGSLVPPSSDLNIDVGVIFHYFTSSAKKAGVYWDDSVSRVVISSDLSETSSVITSTTYAALEVGALWVTDCAGTSQVISCTGVERFLENITVDGGSF